jgi:GNAT superfamily N-acetyltransferase
MDAPAIKLLLEALGYAARTSLLVSQLESLYGKGDHQVLVFELKKEVVGFIAVHYLPQLAFDGGVAIISYLSVDETVKNPDVAGALEKYVMEKAKEKKCERIQVHCLDWRTPVHQFYLSHGYTEYPKYFTKRLIYAE